MDPKLMDKMRKVMALAREGVEGEAEAAAAILQRMLLEHNLSVADLEGKGAAVQEPVERGHDLGKAAFRWKLDLADAVAKHYYCVPLVSRYRKTVAFVGRPDNVESLVMLYAWLIDQVKRVAAEERVRYHAAHPGEHVDPLRWQVGFGVGAVDRLGKRLDEERARQAADAARNEFGDVVALATTRDRENSDYLERTRGWRADGRETAAERGERERREAREAEAARRDAEWLARDPEGHAMAKAKEKADSDAYWAEQDKRERRNAARRVGRAPRAYDPEDERREDQSYLAREAGRAAADRINLRPFLTGDVPADAARRVSGQKRRLS